MLKITVALALVAMMLQSGLRVNRKTLEAALKNHSLLWKAMLANFVVVPAFAFLLVRALHLQPFIATAILLMAIAPVVPFLPYTAGRKVDGSLAFALTLCFIMPTLSIVTVPLTARLVLSPDTQIPASPVIVRLAIFQLAPLLIGMVLAERAPHVAAKLVKPLALIITIAMLAAVVLFEPLKVIAPAYGSYVMPVALVIVLFSLGVGWLFGGPQRPYRNTLAVATAMRNVGLAMTVATVSFPGTPVGSMVAAYFVVQLAVAMLFRAFVHSMKAPGTPAEAAV